MTLRDSAMTFQTIFQDVSDVSANKGSNLITIEDHCDVLSRDFHSDREKILSL